CRDVGAGWIDADIGVDGEEGFSSCGASFTVASPEVERVVPFDRQEVISRTPKNPGAFEDAAGGGRLVREVESLLCLTDGGARLFQREQRRLARWQGVSVNALWRPKARLGQEVSSGSCWFRDSCRHLDVDGDFAVAVDERDQGVDWVACVER